MIHAKKTANQKLSNVIKKIGKKKLISVELNPYKHIDYDKLDALSPSFCSVTWIAREKECIDPKQLEPIKISKELIRKGYVVLIHIPGIFYTKEKMRSILSLLKDYGVRNIFAMRGGGPWLKIENSDFPIAVDFIRFIRDEFKEYFDIVVAGFPHVHPSTGSFDDEMLFLKQKSDAGATVVMTQACMTYERYRDYKENCVKYAIDIPILYGILMMRSWNDFIRIKNMCSFIDVNVMRTALRAKRQQNSREFGRMHTQNIIMSILKDENSLGIHIFTQNLLEHARNTLLQIDARKYQAESKRSHQKI